MRQLLTTALRPIVGPAAAELRRWPQLRRFGQLARFSLVGLSGIVINSAALWALVTRFGLPLLPASMLATEVAIISNFWLNDHWTFRQAARSPAPLQRFLRFNGVAIGGMLITALTLAALAASTDLHLLSANVLAVGAALAWNYTINSRWTWRTAQPSPHHADIAKRLS